jgi:hypothetical protein
MWVGAVAAAVVIVEVMAKKMVLVWFGCVGEVV